MEIPAIKSQLTLATVLHYYGLKPDKNLRLHCPFHEDKTPSMQVYYKTHTCYCFSSKCPTHGHSMDVIDFILHKEGCTKHEAIEKAASLLTGGERRPVAAQVQADQLTKVAVLSKMFIYFKNGVHNSKPAQEYLTSRGIDFNQTEVGYNSGQFHHGARRDEALIKSCVGVGLLSEAGRNNRSENGEGLAAYKSFGKSCVAFALKNRGGQIVGLYFRSAINDKDAKHFYLRDREGLYPGYPKPQTEKLILTEAIIDAASLLQIPKITEQYSVLSLYGTNGLTEEHRAAIKELRHLKEVVFAFDGDEAGEKAAEKWGYELRELCPYLSFSRLVLPAGEDINSVAVAHEDPAVFTKLFGDRDFFLSTEKSVVPTEKESSETSPVLPAELPADFNTTNPFKLCFATGTALYYVQGGVPKAMDSLKITLVIEQRIGGQKSRNKIDLYEDKQIEKLSREASEKLHLRRDFLEADLYRLTDLLEDYRDRQSLQTKADEDPLDMPRYALTTIEREQAESALKSNHLMAELNGLLGKCGIVGEEKTRLFLFIITLSYKMRETLHALIQGSSGSGKTRLLQQVSDCMPSEDVLRFTRVTESSLYNYPEHFFTNKLICFEDIDGLKEDAQFAVRELISNGELSSSTSVKNEAGKIEGQRKLVRGPIASLSATTRGEVYEDNLSRVFLVAVDESGEQTSRVIDYQNKKAAGEISHSEEAEAKRSLQNLVRCIESREVINPFANRVKLPPEAHKIRRLNELFQCFIRMVTVLHQYQRKKDEKGRLVATREDVQMAITVLFESIVLKVDELDGSLRHFYERVKGYLEKSYPERPRSIEFTQREIRQGLQMSKAQCSRLIGQLVGYEYVSTKHEGNLRRQSYRVEYWDSYEALRTRIRSSLEEQLSALGSEVPPTS